MKKLFLIIVLSGFTAFGQNFFESEKDETEVLQSEPFSQNNSTTGSETAGRGGPGNVGEPAPIDEGWYLLLIGGIVLGFYFLYKVPKEKTV